MATTAKATSLRVALLLGAMGAVSTALVFPYLLALMPGVLAAARLPLPLLIAAQAAQAFVVFALIAWIGLSLGARLGLDAPQLRALVGGGGRRWPERDTVAWSIGLGVAAAALIAGLDLAFASHLPPPRAPLPQAVERWRGLLASFYGGIGEEIELRLFLMTLIAWLAWRLAGRPALAPGWIYGLAIVVAALAFGAGHLPLAFKIWGGAPIVVARTLLLNAVAGLAFGWLFWKRGLEAAMLSHFVADLGLHVVSPT